MGVNFLSMYMGYAQQIKVIFFCTCLVFFGSHSGMAQNQPIRVSLKQPAGVELSMSTDERSESQAIPPAVFFSEAGSWITLVWIKIQSFENSQLLIDFKKQPSLGNTGTMYFLNDSKTPLQEAQVFKSFPALLNVHQ
jgi:hypothetical protein